MGHRLFRIFIISYIFLIRKKNMDHNREETKKKVNKQLTNQKGDRIMKKTIFAVIILVAVVSSVITVFGMNMWNVHKKDLVDLTNEVAYRYNAKSVHEEALQRMDNEANANNFTGVASVSAKCGADTLTWNACYINGSRVDAEDFDAWIYDITDEYADALSNAEDTIEEQDDRLSNITLSDWIGCKFN